MLGCTGFQRKALRRRLSCSPENFECRDGGSAFNNPCKHVKPALCPGGYSRYQCISSK
jgi:hypothetical protein